MKSKFAAFLTAGLSASNAFAQGYPTDTAKLDKALGVCPAFKQLTNTPFPLSFSVGGFHQIAATATGGDAGKALTLLVFTDAQDNEGGMIKRKVVIADRNNGSQFLITSPEFETKKYEISLPMIDNPNHEKIGDYIKYDIQTCDRGYKIKFVLYGIPPVYNGITIEAEFWILVGSTPTIPMDTGFWLLLNKIP